MDTNEVVNAPEDFDLFSFLEATEYPTTTVTLYTDTVSASALRELPEKDKGRAALADKIKKSSLTFKLQGLAPGFVQDLYADDKDAVDHENSLIALSIKEVTRGDGAKDNTPWTGEKVSQLRRRLVLSEFSKLVEAVVQVNFDSTLFDNAVDAGFPS